MSKNRKSKSEMNKKNEKTRNWTADKVTLFTEVPSDVKVNFAECLEKRVLKKSANKDVFNSENGKIFQIFTLYSNGHHFSITKLDILIFCNILHLEMDL